MNNDPQSVEPTLNAAGVVEQVEVPILSDQDKETFWSQVDRRGADECWLWQGWKMGNGYGQIFVAGKRRRATHVALLIARGEVVGTGLLVLHSCDAPSCVNPSHLSIGTPADNTADMWSKGRQSGIAAVNARKEYCPRGHPLSGSNLFIHKGGRNCRECERVRKVRWGATRPSKAKPYTIKAALVRARDQFRMYEESYRALGTPEGIEKAETNREMADLCEAALPTKTRKWL